MADPDITTAMSALAVSEAPQPPSPRPNFPLPRELRDQIYGYLLDNQYTRVERMYNPDSKQAYTEYGLTAYHFHTNILGVNHAIHDEAEKLLYERNVFVVASYTCPKFSSLIRSLKFVPIVSTKHVARMKHHSLRIHFRVNNISEDQGIGSVLFVVNQMESFCKMLEGRLTTNPSSSVAIGTMPDTSKHSIRLYYTSNSKSFRLMCELRNTNHRAVTRDLQSSLLSPLASVICDALAVSFRGDIFNFEEIFELKKTMVPSLFSVDARNWARQVSTTALQKIARDALQHHELGLAEYLYGVTFDILAVILRDYACGYPSDLLKSRDFMAMLLKDTQVAISLGWLQIKSHSRQYLKAIAAKIELYVSGVLLGLKQAFDTLPLEVRAYASHFLVLLDLYVCRRGDETSQKTLGEVVDQLARILRGWIPAHHP